jgi:hypothetical protein
LSLIPSTAKQRPENLKLVPEKAGNTLEAIGMGHDFLNRTEMTQQLGENIDKWNSMKLKCFCITNEFIF